MVIRAGKVLVVGALMVILLVVVNGAYLFAKTESSMSIVSGNSIQEVVSGFYETTSLNHRIFILFQFFLLVLIIVIVLIIIKKLKSRARLSKADFMKKSGAESKTDLDILYEMLKREKEVSIEDIGKIFRVSGDVSLEWSKVLEEGDLAMIDYPRFGKPVLRLADNKNDDSLVAKGEDKVLPKKVDVNIKDGEIKGKNISKRKMRKIDKKIDKIDKKIKKVSEKVKKSKKRGLNEKED